MFNFSAGSAGHMAYLFCVIPKHFIRNLKSSFQLLYIKDIWRYGRPRLFLCPDVSVFMGKGYYIFPIYPIDDLNIVSLGDFQIIVLTHRAEYKVLLLSARKNRK